MDTAPGPSSGTLALAALSTDAVISRVLSCLYKEDRNHLRSSSKDVRDACDRQATFLRLPSEPSHIVKALPCLYRLVQRGMQLKELDLSSLTEAPIMPTEGLESLL